MEAVSDPYFLLEGLSKPYLPLETPISRPKKMNAILTPPHTHLANSRLTSYTL